MELAFWIISFSILFIYGGYGLCIWLYNKAFGVKNDLFPTQHSPLPKVTLLIAAYNEEDYIAQKLENSLNLDYPSDKLEIVVVSDGSDDQTVEIVNQFKQVRSLYEPARNGKIHAIHRAMQFVESEITIFTDANCMLNKEAILNIAKHFQDSQVGAVSGEKRIHVRKESKSNAHGEGLYWKIESKLKTIDYQFHSVVGAAGELFAIRTDLYEPVPSDSILDDFAITLSINLRGYKTAYAPDAYAIEHASSEAGEEFKRKVRIAAGGWQMVNRLVWKMNPIKHPKLALIYYVHRASRWIYGPFALVAVFLINLALTFDGSILYKLLFGLQVIFYLVAILGHSWRNKVLPLKGILVPYYLTFMNVAVVAGFFRFLRNKQDVRWDRAQRESSERLITDSVASIV